MRRFVASAPTKDIGVDRPDKNAPPLTPEQEVFIKQLRARYSRPATQVTLVHGASPFIIRAWHRAPGSVAEKSVNNYERILW